MPVFEEKLINPFAIRFTQENIRTTFQDGRELQESLSAIKTQPGDGKNYDLILCAPFPSIEIIRWAGAGRSVKDPDGDQWFTFDNRRLFCLQRAAAAYWPARVAAVVEVLYRADKGSWSKKCDTTTGGMSVNVRHCGVLNDQSLGRWDWQAAVKRISNEAAAAGTVTVAHVVAAKAVAIDCAKKSVDDLMEAPEAPVGVTPAATKSQEPQMRQETSASSESGSDHGKSIKVATPSTGVSSDPEASEGSAVSFDELPEAADEAPRERFDSLLGGTWLGRQGEKYQFQAYDDSTWTCIKHSNESQKKYTIQYDWESGFLWWGAEWSFFMKPSELLERPEQAAWYPAKDFGKHKLKARFIWQKADASQKDEITASQKAPTASCAAEAQQGSQKKWTPKLRTAIR